MLNLSPLALIVAALAGAVVYLFAAGAVLAIVIGLAVLVAISTPVLRR